MPLKGSSQLFWDQAMMVDLFLTRIALKEDMTCVLTIFHPFLDIPLDLTG